jgi:hypothetical protein
MSQVRKSKKGLDDAGLRRETFFLLRPESEPALPLARKMVALFGRPWAEGHYAERGGFYRTTLFGWFRDAVGPNRLTGGPNDRAARQIHLTTAVIRVNDRILWVTRIAARRP